MAIADFVCFRCLESDPENAGPFLDLPLKAKKPKCPNCGASRWMERQWSGYRIGVSVKSHGEPLPRMDHEAVKRMDKLEEIARSRQSAPQKTFEVGFGYGVKAVPLGNVGTEVGKLAGATMGEQAATMTTAQVNAGLKARIGTSRADRGEARALRQDENPGIKPPSRNTEVVGRWTPSDSDIAKASTS